MVFKRGGSAAVPKKKKKQKRGTKRRDFGFTPKAPTSRGGAVGDGVTALLKLAWIRGLWRRGLKLG